jgi:hypothetical protein
MEKIAQMSLSPPHAGKSLEQVQNKAQPLA